MAHGIPRLRAGQCGVFGTSAAFSNLAIDDCVVCGQFIWVSIVETNCAAVDLVFSGVPNYESKPKLDLETIGESSPHKRSVLPAIKT